MAFDPTKPFTVEDEENEDLETSSFDPSLPFEIEEEPEDSGFDPSQPFTVESEADPIADYNSASSIAETMAKSREENYSRYGELYQKPDRTPEETEEMVAAWKKSHDAELGFYSEQKKLETLRPEVDRVNAERQQARVDQIESLRLDPVFGDSVADRLYEFDSALQAEMEQARAIPDREDRELAIEGIAKKYNDQETTLIKGAAESYTQRFDLSKQTASLLRQLEVNDKFAIDEYAKEVQEAFGTLPFDIPDRPEGPQLAQEAWQKAKDKQLENKVATEAEIEKLISTFPKDQQDEIRQNAQEFIAVQKGEKEVAVIQGQPVFSRDVQEDFERQKEIVSELFEEGDINDVERKASIEAIDATALADRQNKLEFFRNLPDYQERIEGTTEEEAFERYASERKGVAAITMDYFSGIEQGTEGYVSMALEGQQLRDALSEGNEDKSMEAAFQIINKTIEQQQQKSDPFQSGTAAMAGQVMGQVGAQITTQKGGELLLRGLSLVAGAAARSPALNQLGQQAAPWLAGGAGAVANANIYGLDWFQTTVQDFLETANVEKIDDLSDDQKKQLYKEAVNAFNASQLPSVTELVEPTMFINLPKAARKTTVGRVLTGGLNIAVELGQEKFTEEWKEAYLRNYVSAHQAQSTMGAEDLAGMALGLLPLGGAKFTMDTVRARRDTIRENKLKDLDKYNAARAEQLRAEQAAIDAAEQAAINAEGLTPESADAMKTVVEAAKDNIDVEIADSLVRLPEQEIAQENQAVQEALIRIDADDRSQIFQDMARVVVSETIRPTEGLNQVTVENFKNDISYIENLINKNEFKISELDKTQFKQFLSEERYNQFVQVVEENPQEAIRSVRELVDNFVGKLEVPVEAAGGGEEERITPAVRTIADSIRDKDTFVYEGMRGSLTEEDGQVVFREFGTQEKYEVGVQPAQTLGEIEGIQWARRGQRRQRPEEARTEIATIIEGEPTITQEEVDTIEDEFETPAALIEIEKSQTLNGLADLFDTGESKVVQEGKRAKKVSDTPEFYRQVQPEQISQANRLIDSALRIIDALPISEDQRAAMAEPFLLLDQDISNYESNPEYQRYKSSIRTEVRPAVEAGSIPETVGEVEAGVRELEQRATAEAARLEQEAQARRVAAGQAAFIAEPQVEAIGRVARAEATPEEFESLVERGFAEEYKGQQVITQAGIDALPQDQRPRLTPEARKIQIDTGASVAAAEAISKGLRIGVDQVPPNVRMPEGWTLDGDIYIPPTVAEVKVPKKAQPLVDALKKQLGSDVNIAVVDTVKGLERSAAVISLDKDGNVGVTVILSGIDALSKSAKTPKALQKAIEKVADEEVDHVAAIKTIGYDGVSEAAKRLSPEQREAVARLYINRSNFASDSEYNNAIKEFAGTKVGATQGQLDSAFQRVGFEYLRQVGQRVRTGQTTEDIFNADTADVGIVRAVLQYLSQLASQIRAKLEVTFDSELQADLNRIDAYRNNVQQSLEAAPQVGVTPVTPAAPAAPNPDANEEGSNAETEAVVTQRAEAKKAQELVTGHSILPDEVPAELREEAQANYQNGMTLGDFFNPEFFNLGEAYNPYIAATWLELNGGLMPTVKVEGKEIAKPEKGTSEAEALRLLKRASDILDSRSETAGGKELTYSLQDIMATWMESGLGPAALKNAIVQFTNLDVAQADKTANDFANVYQLAQNVTDSKERARVRMDRALPAVTGRQQREKERMIKLEEAAGSIDSIAEAIRIAYDIGIKKPKTDKATEKKQIEEQLRQAKQILRDVVPKQYLGDQLLTLERATGIEGLKKVVEAAQNGLNQARLDEAVAGAKKSLDRAQKAVKANEIGPEAMAVLRDFVETYSKKGIGPETRAKIEDAISRYEADPVGALQDLATEKYLKQKGALGAIKIDKSLGLDALKEISRIINTTLHADKVARGEMLFNKQETRQEVITGISEEIDKVKSIAKARKDGGQGIGLFNKVAIYKGARVENILRAFGLNKLSEFVYDRLTLDAYQDELRVRRDLKKKIESRVKEITGLEIGTKDYDLYSKEVIELTGVDSAGRTKPIKVRRYELLDILASLRDPSNLKRAVNSGGYVIDRLDLAEVDTVKITPETYIEILNKATDQDNQMVEMMVELYNNDLFQILENASVQAYGHGIKAVSGTYYPRTADKWTRATEVKKDLDYIAYYQRRVDDVGYLKERDERSKSKLRAVDFLERLDYHVTNDARIGAYLPIVRDIEMVLGDPAIARPLASKIGEDGLTMIREMVRQQTTPPAGLKAGLLSTLIGNAGVGVLGFKLHAAMQNPVGLPIALAYYGKDGVKYLAKAFPAGIRATKKGDRMEMEKILSQYAPYYNERYGDGGFIQEFTSGLSAAPSNRKWRRNLETASMSWLEASDKWGALVRYKLAQQVVQDRTTLESGTEEFNRAVAREWTKMMFRSENTAHGGDRTGVFQDVGRNPALKLFVMFQSAVSKQYSLFAEAMLRAQQGGKENLREAAFQLGFLSLSLYISRAISNAFYSTLFPPEDDEEKTWGQFLGKAIGTPLSIVPVVGSFLQNTTEAIFSPENMRKPMQIDLVSSVLFGMYDVSLLFARAYGELSEEKIDEATGNPKFWETSYRAITKAGGLAGVYFGIPIGGVVQTAQFGLRLKERVGDVFSGEPKTEDFQKKIKEYEKEQRTEPVTQEYAKIFFAVTEDNQREFNRALKDLKAKRPDLSRKDVINAIRRRPEFRVVGMVRSGKMKQKDLEANGISRDYYLTQKALLRATEEAAKTMYRDSKD
jgi:hypothetical protein